MFSNVFVDYFNCVIFINRTPEKAKEMEEAVHGRNVEKEYLARVVGDFPR